MQIGTENRTKTIAALSLTVLAAVLVVVRFFPGSSPAAAPPVASTVAATRQPARRVAETSGNTKSVARSLDPTLRYDWLKASEDTKYEGTGRNIFRAEIEPPKPVSNGTTDHAQNTPPPAPQGPPPPPPITLKFFGFANKPGEPKRVFLSQGEDVFIAAEGDIVDRRYKVLRISPMAVEVEDVLNNNRQSIPLTQG
jgi:hypothetical protein